MKAVMLLALALAAPAVAEPAFNPHAGELIESSPALKAWALARYDANHDGWLTLFEAQGAAEAFRDLADADRDGSVSVREYEAAVAFIHARY